MKEDILEQLVDDYFQSSGYFTRHNIKFRPSPDHADYVKNQDSNHSDIDIIAIDPKREGFQKVKVISCKSWQAGFRTEAKIRELQDEKVTGGRQAWKGFRELIKPKWSEAFLKKIEFTTGSRKFTYVTAVTKIVGNKETWEQYPPFLKALQGNPIELLDISQILESLEKNHSTTLASSSIGRLLQVMKAARLNG